MKNIKNIYIVLLSMTIAFLGCQEKEYEFGDIIAPSSIVINAEVIGQDVNDPDLANGDGSGTVKFTVSADNASSYVYYFNGVAVASPSGILSKRFSKVGTNIYTVVVNANGTGGVSTTKSMDIEVYSSFTDLEGENFLRGANIGYSK
jgi:hypothetical protein